jgi:hypothetical protein
MYEKKKVQLCLPRFEVCTAALYDIVVAYANKLKKKTTAIL